MSLHPSNNKNDLITSTDLPRFALDWIESINDDFAMMIWNEQKELVYVSKTIKILTGFAAADLYCEKWEKIFSADKLTNIHYFFDGEHLDINELDFEDDNIEYKFGKITEHDKLYYICQLKNKHYVNHLENKISDLQKGIIHTEKMAIAGEFSAGLVHEIRNPLTSLKGFVQLVQAGIEQKEEYYQVMIEEIEKIETITAELLMMSKPFSDAKKNVSIKKMIDDSVLIMTLPNEYKHISFEVNCPQQSVIKCNERQIKQVLMNLFKNASEAMEMNGKIIINVNEKASSIEIEVVDEGEGVSDETIFELGKAFYTTKESGTGLGLVVTNQILDSHQASMSITSEKGEGSKFTISFPRP